MATQALFLVLFCNGIFAPVATESALEKYISADNEAAPHQTEHAVYKCSWNNPLTLGNNVSTRVFLAGFQRHHASLMLLGPIMMEILPGRERVRVQWDRPQVCVLLPSVMFHCIDLVPRGIKYNSCASHEQLLIFRG